LERVTYRGALFRRRTEMVTGVGPFKGLVGSIALSRTSLRNRIPRELFHYLVFPQSPAAKRSDAGYFIGSHLLSHPRFTFLRTASYRKYGTPIVHFSVSDSAGTNFSKICTCVMFGDNAIKFSKLTQRDF